MKNVIFAALVMAGAALADGRHHRAAPPGQYNNGASHRQHGGWSGRSVHVAPRWAPTVGVYPRLPAGVVSLRVGGRPYWYGGGVYYVPSSAGYAVTAAPLGATVTVLPPGAVQQQWNGGWYASACGAWYQWDGWRGVWVVVSAPW